MNSSAEKLDAWHHAWAKVDSTDAPEFFVRFLAATRKKTIRAMYANPKRYFAHLYIQEGDQILDVGCGLGETLHPLADMVGAGGRVVGVDAGAVMIAEACKRAAHRHARVEYQVGDVYRLAFPDATFTCCMAESVFQHLEAPHRALTEMIRVARPGARIVITEPDWETQIVDAADHAATRRILNFFSDSIRNGWIARRLPALFLDAGLKRITITNLVAQMTGDEKETFEWLRESALRAREAGVVSAHEADHWVKDLEERVQRGRFFSSFTAFRVSGFKE